MDERIRERLEALIPEGPLRELYLDEPDVHSIARIAARDGWSREGMLEYLLLRVAAERSIYRAEVQRLVACGPAVMIVRAPFTESAPPEGPDVAR